MRNLMIIMMLIFAPLVYGQQLTVNENNTKLSVDGTSSVHDWTIEAEQFEGKADVKVEYVNQQYNCGAWTGQRFEGAGFKGLMLEAVISF